MESLGLGNPYFDGYGFDGNGTIDCFGDFGRPYRRVLPLMGGPSPLLVHASFVVAAFGDVGAGLFVSVR